jgi:hypothetical protein
MQVMPALPNAGRAMSPLPQPGQNGLSATGRKSSQSGHMVPPAGWPQNPLPQQGHIQNSMMTAMFNSSFHGHE